MAKARRQRDAHETGQLPLFGSGATSRSQLQKPVAPPHASGGQTHEHTAKKPPEDAQCGEAVPLFDPCNPNQCNVRDRLREWLALGAVQAAQKEAKPKG